MSSTAPFQRIKQWGKAIPALLMLSVFVGLASGLVVYNFFQLRNYVPTHGLLISITIMACIAATLAYYLVAKRLAPAWQTLLSLQKWIVLVITGLLGVYLLATTTGLKVSLETVALFTPSQTLDIYVPADQDPNFKIIVYYLSTEAGDVSFDDVTYLGWQKTKAEAGLRQSGSWLVLSDFAYNSFRWTGKPGGNAQLAFERSTLGGVVEVTWNGVTESIDLSFHREAKYFYNTQFSISIHQAKQAVLLMSTLAFFAWSLPLVLYVLSNRSELEHSLTDAILPSPAKPTRKHSFPIGALIILMLIALLPRIFYLGRELITIDEPNHLLAAKALLSGASLNSVYQRGLYMVTLPVALFTSVFGDQLWAAKLPGVLMNVLGVIPLFLIVDKVNRKAAVLTCFLFALDPWVIGMSRYVREYAYYPMFFYWVVLGMLVVVEGIPGKFVLTRDWKAVINWRFAAAGAGVLVSLFYVLFIDQSSTVQVIAIAYAIFPLFVFGKFDLREKANHLPLAITGLVLVILTFLLWNSPGFSIGADLSIEPLRLFFPNPSQQIFFERPAILFALALIVTLGFVSVRVRHNFIPAFLWVLFLVSLFGFSLFWGRSVRPRYFFSLQLWFIPLVGIGLYGLWLLFRRTLFTRPELGWTAVVTLLALSVNPHQVLATAKAEAGLEAVTEQFTYDMEPIENLLINEARQGEVLISNVFVRYATWTQTLNLQMLYPPSSLPERFDPFLLSILETHGSGWLVLGAGIDWGNLPRETVEMNGKTLEYLGEFGFQVVWHWSPSR